MTDFHGALPAPRSRFASTVRLALPRILSFTFKLILLGGLYFAYQQRETLYHRSHYFPLHEVTISGATRSDKAQVEKILTPLLSGGFFNSNVEEIRDAALTLPWVKNVYVQKIWPDKVNIVLEEKRALSRWNNAGLLSVDGELFSPPLNSYPQGLPQFIAEPGQQLALLDYFANINRLLHSLHVKITQLELTPYFAWRLTLENGIVLQLGYKHSLTRLEQFVKVYPKIVGARAKDVAYIDLRYPNGIAVKWKSTKKPDSS